MENRVPELYNEELEWFLTQADADCGLKSSFGAQLEVMHRRQLQAVTEEDEEIRKFRTRNVKRAQLTLSLGRPPSTSELDTSIYYAEKMGVGRVDAPAKEEPSVESRQPYGDGHCTFKNNPKRDHAQTAFAKLRRCSKRWQNMTYGERQTAAAYYLGMNPQAAPDLRELMRRTFGDFAAVVYWAADGDAGACSSCTEEHKATARLMARMAVTRAHKSWANGA